MRPVGKERKNLLIFGHVGQVKAPFLKMVCGKGRTLWTFGPVGQG